MIGGTQQADVGVLVISARKGSLKLALIAVDKRGARYACKTLGIKRLIVMINKMDEKSVKWSKERYDQIVKKLSPFLKKWGYNLKKEVQFCPVSGLTGINLKDPIDPKQCSWYKGSTFINMLDSLKPLKT
eukprot:TRINITY_DN7722_c1_g1_i1.p1 TRINITY_DN7722_c1_g1~~TRINITY_DN7722_c1_g1_i1.p1  ORF type:complete len:130 (-),score=9.31 TRINITY_DN7722_c1_g1_i1:154-543(-)